MNCPNCGTVLPQGAQSCPACGTFIPGVQGYPGYPPQQGGGYPQGFDPTAYGQGGYAQGYPQQGYGQGSYPQAGYDPSAYGQNGYPQGFDPTAYGYPNYGGYPQGYQPVYGRYNTASGDHGAFLNAMSNLPRVLTGLFSDPADTLQGMMERNDLYTGGVIAVLTLLFTFLSAMFVTRSVVASLFSGLSSFLNTSLAGNAASMNQGVSYIAGKIATPVGGIAVLCQVFALALPAVVAMVYLCAVRKVRFSFLLLSNFVALTTLPSIASSLLCMLASLISPYAGFVMVFMGVIASYVIACALISRIACLTPQQSVMVSIAVICLSELLKILFVQLVGGTLMASTLRTLSSLIGSMGSLL